MKNEDSDFPGKGTYSVAAGVAVGITGSGGIVSNRKHDQRLLKLQRSLVVYSSLG